jgi:hypothetical protein
MEKRDSRARATPSKQSTEKSRNGNAKTLKIEVGEELK